MWGLKFNYSNFAVFVVKKNAKLRIQIKFQRWHLADFHFHFRRKIPQIFSYHGYSKITTKIGKINIILSKWLWWMADMVKPWQPEFYKTKICYIVEQAPKWLFYPGKVMMDGGVRVYYRWRDSAEMEKKQKEKHKTKSFRQSWEWRESFESGRAQTKAKCSAK